MTHKLLCAGMLNLLVGAVVDVLCCQYKWGSYSQTQDNDIHRPRTPTTPSASVNPIYSNSPSASPTETVQLVAGPVPTTFDT